MVRTVEREELMFRATWLQYTEDGRSPFVTEGDTVRVAVKRLNAVLVLGVALAISQILVSVWSRTRGGTSLVLESSPTLRLRVSDGCSVLDYESVSRGRSASAWFASPWLCVASALLLVPAAFLTSTPQQLLVALFVCCAAALIPTICVRCHAEGHRAQIVADVLFAMLSGELALAVVVGCLTV